MNPTIEVYEMMEFPWTSTSRTRYRSNFFYSRSHRFLNMADPTNPLQIIEAEADDHVDDLDSALGDVDREFKSDLQS